MRRPLTGPEKMARERRWTAPGRAKVVHPKHGSVIVPHCSNLAAIENAAEYWRVEVLTIMDAQVWAAAPGEGPVAIPKEFCRRKTP